MRHVFLTVVGVGLLAGLAGLVGCQAEREVAADRIKETIDGVLGKLDVKQKEVEIQLKALETGINEIREAKIVQQVELERINKEVEPIIAKQLEVKAQMAQVKTALDAGMSVSLGGTTYSIDELQKAGSDLIGRYKKLDSDMKTALAIKPNYEKRVAELNAKQATYTAQIADLKESLKKIKADMITAKAYQKASAAMGSVDDSVATNVDKLKQNLAELDAQVQTVIMREDDKFSSTTETAKSNETDMLINALKQPTDVSSELDEILGKKK